MAKFYGPIGFAETRETSPGVWTEEPIVRNYYGDIINNSRRLESDKINNDIAVSVDISIVADAYALNNFHALRYAEYMGTKWRITNAQVEHPRIRLSLGGIYNG